MLSGLGSREEGMYKSIYIPCMTYTHNGMIDGRFNEKGILVPLLGTNTTN